MLFGNGTYLQLHTKIYDKCGDCNFPIVNLPYQRYHTLSYGIYIFQFKRYARNIVCLNNNTVRLKNIIYRDISSISAIL